MKQSIRDLMSIAGLTSVFVAEQLGIHESSLSLKLSGRRPFRVEELQAIRDLLNQPENLKKLEREERPVSVDELCEPEAIASARSAA